MDIESFIFDLKNQNGNLYLYGAGFVGIYVVKELVFSRGLHVSGIMVTDPTQNLASILGIKIEKLHIPNNKKKDYVLVATLTNYHSEINKNLREMGWQNIYTVSEAEAYSFRNSFQDLDGEIFSELKRVKSELCQILVKQQKRISEIQGNTYQFYNEWKRYEYIYDEEECTRLQFETSSILDRNDNLDIRITELTKGLDNNSIETVYLIMDRLYKIKSGTKIRYTEEEKKELYKLQTEFYEKIFRIGENCFYWNGYYLPKYHFDPTVFYYKLGLDKIKDINRIRELDVIDAGAYIGDSAVVLSKFIHGQIYAFEPAKNSYELIKQTALINGETKSIIPEYYAIYDSRGEIDLYYADHGRDSCNRNEIDGYYVKSGEIKEKVPSISIDEFVHYNNLKIGIIKSDIEGAEIKLLKGAIETIKSQRPILIISIYHSINDFFNIKPMIESMNLGYSFTIYRPITFNTIMIGTLLIGQPN